MRDQLGRRDLRASRADAIGSVANFLASHGWVADAPIALPARVEGEAYRALVDGEVVPIHRADVLRAMGNHISYHVAQIALLRRMMGAWPPPGGGDTW